MKQATRKSTNQKPLPLHIKQRLHEAFLILSIAGALFLLLSLVTYHSSDPGWSDTGATATIANAGGKAGAWLSDVLLYLFGYTAYLFPLMIIYASWMGFHRQQQEDDSHRWSIIIRTAGFVIVLATASGISSLSLSHSAHLPYSAGGILGNGVGLGMLNLLNGFGAAIILWSLLLTGITLFTGLSWLKVSDYVGEFIIKIINKLHAYIKDLHKEKIAENRNLAIENIFKPKIETKPVPKIIPHPAVENPPIVNTPKKIEPSIRAEKEKSSLFEPAIEGSLPPLTLLDNPDKAVTPGYSSQQLEEMSRQVELRLQDFGVEAKVVAVHPGPVVTRFELQLAAGTKVSRISNLVKDLARSLSVTSVRIVEVIPGKSVIGLELPNESREIVRLREILSSQQYDNARSPVTLALGKDIAGHPVIVDLAKMPHLLVAGTTGAGKSVCLNALLLSLLYKSTPKDLRIILIDPKMLELSIYQDVPHLLVPVVTDMKDTANALRWCVAEMDRRYRLMAALGVRNLAGYNSKIREAIKKGAPLLDPIQPTDAELQRQELQELPFIVVIADEFADMMMVVGKKIEELIARIAQKARAAGIHLILATQRPSVDVITGLIKANIPTRIAFQVSSKIDSRTILDQGGAEQLLGHGDMLYLAPGTGVPVRVHGAFVSDDEVHAVVADLKRRGKPDYLEEILEGSDSGEGGSGGFGGAGEIDAEQDALYDQAVKIVLETRRASISSIQRRLKIGYNRAANIVEAMERAGLVSAMDTNGSREVLAPAMAE